MRASVVMVVLAAAMALPATASAASAGDRCGSVASGGVTFPVVVVSGEVACSDATAALQSFLDDAAAPAGWTCARGHFGDPFGAQCGTDAGVVVQARNTPRLSGPQTAKLGGKVSVTASGLKAGRYSLTLVADDKPARGANCLANLGSVKKARGGWVRFDAKVPAKLRCYQGANVLLGTVPTTPGAYHLVVGVKVAPAAWGKGSFLRRKLRVKR